MRGPELDVNATLLAILGVGASTGLVLIAYAYRRRGKCRGKEDTSAPLCSKNGRQFDNGDLVKHAYDPIWKTINKGSQPALIPSEEMSLEGTGQHIEKVRKSEDLHEMSAFEKLVSGDASALLPLDSARSVLPEYLAAQFLPSPVKETVPTEDPPQSTNPANDSPQTKAKDLKSKQAANKKHAASCTPTRLTEHHFKLDLDRAAGGWLDSFGANMVVPDSAFTLMGTVHVFEHALGFCDHSSGPRRRVCTTPLAHISALRRVPVMGIRVEVQDPETLEVTTHTFMYLVSRDQLFALLTKMADLREVGDGQARKKGKVTTMAEQQLAAKRAAPGGATWAGSLGRLGGRHATVPLPELNTVHVDRQVACQLFIKVHGARDLAAMDHGLSSDPYCQIQLAGLVQKTRVIRQCLNPDWDEVFQFPISPNIVLEKEKLSVTLFDWDFAESQALHDFLGWAEMGMEDVPLGQMHKKTTRTLSLTLAPGMKTSSWLKKYITMEGDVPITGEVTISMWMGTMKDTTMNVAKPAERSPDAVEMDNNLTCFVEPHMLVMHIDAIAGRNLLACNPGGTSDPYFKVKLAEGTGYAISERTKYLRATLNPKWNEEFNFLVGKPLNDKLAISVWDKDLAYDELIGRVHLELADLPVVKGHQIDKALPAEWHTLKDNKGRAETKKGEPYGQVKMRAYLDNEYFSHPEDSMFSKECGRVEVDVLNARDLKGSGEYYCVVKFDRLLARTPVQKQRGASGMHRGLEWNQRLSFPVYDTCPCVVIGLFNAAKSHALVGKVRVRLSSLRGNTRYEKAVQLVNLDARDKLHCSGLLDIAITFKHACHAGVGWGVLQRYTKSNIPEKHFWRPLPAMHLQRMEVRRRHIIAETLDRSYPRLHKTVVLDMYDAKESEFSLRLMKATMARMKMYVDVVEKAGKVFRYLESWQNSFASMASIGTVCFYIIFPEYIIPSMMGGVLIAGVITYPSSYDRQMEYIGMDEALSIGQAPFEQAIKSEQVGETLEPDSQEATSLNPLITLQKKYDEMITMAQIAQLKMADAAGLIESCMSMLTWGDPRCTSLVMMGCASAILALHFVPLTAPRIKFMLAGGFAYVMRPPILRNPTPNPPEIWLSRMPTLKDRIFY